MDMFLRFREIVGNRGFLRKSLSFICFVCVRVYRLICPLFVGMEMTVWGEFANTQGVSQTWLVREDDGELLWFATLVNLLDYPDHIASAVCFTEEVSGDAVVLADGSRYVICDPTYIGAPVGRCMDSYKNVSPDVIFWMLNIIIFVIRTFFQSGIAICVYQNCVFLQGEQCNLFVNIV